MDTMYLVYKLLDNTPVICGLFRDKNNADEFIKMHLITKDSLYCKKIVVDF